MFELETGLGGEIVDCFIGLLDAVSMTRFQKFGYDSLANDNFHDVIFRKHVIYLVCYVVICRNL